MFPVNTILASIINIYHDYKEINNNFIIASRAYFLHFPRLQVGASKENSMGSVTGMNVLPGT